MKFNIFLLLFLINISFFLGQYSNLNIINLEKIAQHIELQKRAFVEDHTPNEYILTEEDLLLQQPLIVRSLVNSGYKIPEYSEFKKRIADYFKVDLDKSKENIVTLYIDEPVFNKGIGFTDEEIKNIILKTTNLTFDLYKYRLATLKGNLFIDKERKIVTPMNFLETLIQIDNVKKNKYKIKQNLKLLSLNKYLIYNDSTSLTYLLSREKELVHSLLLDFNYDQDNRINESVMDSIYREDLTFGRNNFLGIDFFNLVFKKEHKNHNLYIRSGILSTIENDTNNQNIKYATILLNYSDEIINELSNKNSFYTTKELYKILAYLANTIDFLSMKYKNLGMSSSSRWNILGKYYYSAKKENWEKLINEFKTNNYYNLPNLKKVVNYAEQFDSVGAPD
ncbi:hypothetical protein C4S76_00085 [Apibacter adventoris]|nr:hypothetical protein C4S76_00085 [Apibacter adventoris]